MLIDWNFDLPWWALISIGFIAAMVISAFLFNTGRSTSDKKFIESLQAALHEADVRYRTLIAETKVLIDDSHALSVSSRETLISTLDSYKDAWSSVRELLKKMRKRLEDHQNANIMERSLVESLNSDLAAVEYTVNHYLLNGIDPEGRHTKTVKKDDDGGNSGEEIDLQAASQESQEHERSGKQSET